MATGNRRPGDAADAAGRQVRQRRAVLAADRTAELVITAGGLSVIAAVLGIILYLGLVTLPLLSPGRAEVASRFESGEGAAAALIDEYRAVAAMVRPDGQVDALGLVGSDLVPLESWSANVGSEAARPVIAVDAPTGLVAVASADGVRIGRLGFRSAIVPVSPTGAAFDASRRAAVGHLLIEQLGPEQFRTTRAVFEALADLPAASAPLAVDVTEGASGPIVAVWCADGSGFVVVLRRPRGLMTDGEALTLERAELPPRDGAGSVAGLALLRDGRELVVVGSSGAADRYALSRRTAALIETRQLLADGASVAVVGPVLGRGSFVVASEAGDAAVWSVALDPADRSSRGELVLVRREGRLTEGTPRAFAPSMRDRTVFLGDESGRVYGWHATSGKRVVVQDAELGGGISAIAAAPKLDGLLVVGGDRASLLDLETGHPAATVRTLFLPVVYEGTPEASFVYQASSAEDDAEPKLSLTPLIFGTIKATVFSLLFAVPLAVLAAIYTSEFMEERHRRVIKPGIEMMASLPSVVLGFIAAMVVAPLIRDHLTTVLVGLFLAPVAALVAAGCWAFVPRDRAIKAGPAASLGMALAAGLAGLAVASAVAGPVEQALFAPSDRELSVLAGLATPAAPEAEGAFEMNGSWYAVSADPGAEAESRVLAMQDEFLRSGSTLKNWLGGVFGDAWPGWFALLTPVVTLLVGTVGWGLLVRARPGVTDSRWQPLVQVGSSVLVGLVVAAAGAWVLASGGYDARSFVLGPFTQRNTLVVGVIMGFAIIPIIYTISDDAMRSVPLSLKAASLGAGATRWQTAVRVVMPVAASGIFSAVMIGLGRAVGETMIVLMATGNTPVMDWNMFSGLRTLSANIAVELPEAERGGTHYRLLFLCGVVLFLMTFVVNTTAEIVRQRFRRRNSLL
ncbi:MAG: ABC transporter permease subunit [Phycisphaerales bacterium]